uniref:Uncharacterized protein n=1 Tax=Arundo donax TaxID=35708 RepID=A0A0A9DTA0_ARUDO
MPSNFEVNWYPHSVLSFTSILLSESSEAAFPERRRFARCCL